MDKQQILENLSTIKNLIAEIEFQLGQNPSFDNTSPDFEELKLLLNSDEWPEAVDPMLICDQNSGEDKMNRAHGILETIVTEPVAGKRFLDFGTGEGHVVKAASEKNAIFSIGYDIKNAFIEKSRNIEFSNDWRVIQQNAPYDIITICDTLDHLENSTALDALSKAKSVLSPSGKIYLRHHNYMSRHATHLYKQVNKAFLHLILTDRELEILFPAIQPEPTTKVFFPIKTYHDNIGMAGLKIVSEIKTTTPVEPFFENEIILGRIYKNTPFKSLPRIQMELDFVDYILTN